MIPPAMTRDTAVKTEAESVDVGAVIERLRERYTADEVPPCRVCGGPLGLQAIGGGRAPVWGCNAQPFYFDHYERSRWTQYREGDDDVLLAASLIADQAGKDDVLREALTLFRRYESEHTAKLGRALLTPTDAHATTVKAERNRAIADKIEAALAPLPASGGGAS